MQLVDFCILFAFCLTFAIVQHLGGHATFDAAACAVLFALLVVGRVLKGERL